MGTCVPVAARGTAAKLARQAEPRPVGVDPKMLGGMYPWNELSRQRARLYLMDVSDADDAPTGFGLVCSLRHNGTAQLRKHSDILEEDGDSSNSSI